MTFLNPFVLIALAAAALPLLLHLLTLRKLRTIEFSSIRFLKELQKTSLRRLRFRQILLLVVRTLLVIVIVLLFARPALRGTWAGLGPGDAPGTMVIVIDDSPSMEMRDQRGSSMSRAIAHALSFLDAAGERDHVMILPLSEARNPDDHPPTLSPAEARKTVAALKSSSLSVPLSDAVRRAATLIESTQDANKEIVLISDGQESQFADGVSPGDSAAALPPNVRLFFLTTPSSRAENSGIVAAAVENRLLAPRQQVSVRATVASTGAPAGTIVRLTYDGRTVAQKQLTGVGEEDMTFSFIPGKSGLGSGTVELDDDGIPGDNQRCFAMSIPARLAVLLVGPDLASTHWAALSLQPVQDSLAQQEFALRRITEPELNATSLDSVAVVILCGVAGPSPADGLRLARFVREGGGLIVFPGPSTRPGTMNADLLQPLGIPPVAPQPVSAPEAAPMAFGQIDRAHPVFEGLFEPKPGRRTPVIESPRMVKALPAVPGEHGRSVIALPGGGAFLADYSCGMGRAMLFAVDAGLAWSDFARKGIFPPLMHRVTVFCGATQTQPPMLTVGDALTFTMRSRMIRDREVFSLVRPSGSVERVLPEFSPADASARFHCGIALEQGIYRLTRSHPGTGSTGETVALAAVNLRPEESALAVIPDPALNTFLRSTGVPADQAMILHEGESPEQSVRTARLGTELWKVFAVLALALALAEMLIGRVPKEEQTGS
jgi:hypothetical protein